MNKLIAFIISILMLWGAFGEKIEVKSQLKMNKLTFSDADITDGYTVSLQAYNGSIRFNRVSFSYNASAPVRAVFEYKQDSDILKEELLLGSKGKKTIHRKMRRVHIK